MSKCGLCGYENPGDSRVCGACTATLTQSNGPPPAGAPAAPHDNVFVPPPDTLRRVAERTGDPALLPGAVLDLYERGQRLDAHALLLSELDREPSRRAARLALADDLRLWAQPSGAPSLFTLNGVGFSAYGEHDPQPDGTYVLVSYFVVLFLPVFPLAAFLVATAPGSFSRSWYFLAQVPLPPGTRRRRWWAIGAAGLALAIILLVGLVAS